MTNLPQGAAATVLPRLAERAGQHDTAGAKGLTLALIGDDRAAIAALAVGGSVGTMADANSAGH